MSPIRVCWASRLLGAAVLVTLAALPSQAGIIAVKPASAASEQASRDLGLTMHARRLLLRDRALGPLNLGVQVRGRVATLWGPVPSAELALKAEACVRSMFEIAEVHNELFVTGDESVADRSRPAYLPPEPRPELPVIVPPRLPGVPEPVVQAPPAPAPRADDEPEPLPMRLPPGK